ncbi:ABC transporter substrate-binding protein [Ensifer adhaerens]|uniref:ABC transporter substrate-binding protein n=2 Tax=Ensifer adhaerens TaxID=106592 RepID=A0A0L8C7G3_ENSAD|nr:extracellular solute-binding protein [Ensifer adhaerens]KOF22862.1 ABC transporter substrate-binding protein [Ensifer adhaerens]
MFSAGALALGLLAAQPASAVEIEYWQYVFESRVHAMDELIKEFEAENPDITVKQVTFPYADYQTRVVAAKAAGNGPDVVQLFYGWLDNFVAGGLVQPLSKEKFPAADIEKDFFPIVSAMKRGEDYYGLPTAVRSMALFYNKNLFKDAGLDPNKPPQTLDEMVKAAKATTKQDSAGNFQTVGMALDIARQDHNWWREILIRQFGGEPYSADGTKVTYNSDGGRKALEFYTGLQSGEKVGQEGFMDEGQAAFRAGLAAMVIDGTFRLASFNTISGFEWGVTELPAAPDGTRSNYASYFANAIGGTAEGEKLEAAEKFLAFISSEKAMKVWLEKGGELPARKSIALSEENLAHPVYGPFIRGLTYAHTTLFVDEAAQRQITIDMVNSVLLQGQPVTDALSAAAAKEQQLLDKRKAN